MFDEFLASKYETVKQIFIYLPDVNLFFCFGFFSNLILLNVDWIASDLWIRNICEILCDFFAPGWSLEDQSLSWFCVEWFDRLTFQDFVKQYDHHWLQS